MKLISEPIIAAAVILAGCTLTRAAPPVPSTEKLILEMERAFRAAQLSKDRDALFRLLAPDYVHIHAGDGKVSTREEYIIYVTGPALTYTSVEATNVALKHYGTAVVVLSDVAVAGRSRGNEIKGADGGPFRFRSTRTYLKREGRWQAVFGQGTAL